MGPGPQKAAGTGWRTLVLGGRAATTTIAPPPGSTRTGRARSGPRALPPAQAWGATDSGSCAQPSAYLRQRREEADRKSTRLNSSHANISNAVFCLKKKKKKIQIHLFEKKQIKTKRME